MATSRSLTTYADEQQKQRFQVELEFVQCLANPNYLTFLAQRGTFKDQSFINYLRYLLYWKEAEYAKFLKYPQCLHMLELLQYESFRRELTNPNCSKFIEEQQLLHWQHYLKTRIKLIQEQADNVNTTTNAALKNANNAAINAVNNAVLAGSNADFNNKIS